VGPFPATFLLEETAPPLPRRRPATPSTPPRMRFDRGSRRARTRRGSGSSKGSSRAPSSGSARRASAGGVPLQEQHRLGRQLVTAATRTYWWSAKATSPSSPTCSFRFLVTRQVYAGAGKVLRPAGAMYCISQRAEAHLGGRLERHTRSRPIINTRDEPHAARGAVPSLHVIVGDSNMSEYTTFLKVGTGRSCCGCSRGPEPWREPHPGEPDPAIREISHDMTCRRRVRSPTAGSSPRSRSSPST